MHRWLCLLLLAGAACAHAAVQVTDDRGMRVAFAQPPQRIVSEWSRAHG